MLSCCRHRATYNQTLNFINTSVIISNVARLDIDGNAIQNWSKIYGLKALPTLYHALTVTLAEGLKSRRKKQAALLY
jgi:hypothetical protein